MGKNYKELFTSKKTYPNKEAFMKDNYITCCNCGYNNEKKRLKKYGVCLNCGEPLDDEAYFMIKMQTLLTQSKRRNR